LESHSTHPVARAVVEYAANGYDKHQVTGIEEIKGYGLKGNVNGREILAGNVKLLHKFGIAVPDGIHLITDSIVVVAVDNAFAGYLTVADELKEDSKEAIRQMHARGIKTIILNGDKQSVASKIADELGSDHAHGDSLPYDKVRKVEEIKAGKKEPLAFVGDGINDAPVLAISDVGIAMGGLGGSDAAIETADVVIQTDQPSKIVTAMRIGKATNGIVWQNITLALGVKVI